MRISRYLALMSLLVPAFAWAQTHDHSRPEPPIIERPDGVPGDLSGLLRSGDELLRLIERAVEQDDSPAVAALLPKFISVTASIEDFFASEPPRSAKDATRARRVLERHIRALGELAEAAAGPDPREPVQAAYDAAQRALDAVEAAGVTSDPAPSAGHHGTRRRGCGR